MSDILIIDDDPGFTGALAEIARLEGFVPRLAGSLAQGRDELRLASDVLVLDLDLPDGSGLELLGEIDPARHQRVVIVTGHPSVETAVQAVGAPVSDYLLKPFDPAAFTALLRQSRRVARSGGVPGAEPIPGVVTACAVMREPTRLARALAATDAAILLSGEAGTGKDLFARAIHAMSGRRGPFVRLDCASTPGAQLGAQLRGDGGCEDVFGTAAGGTLFVDAVDALPAALQPLLLQRLEAGLEDSAGHSAPRVVSAMRMEPAAATADGRLDEALGYLLADMHIAIPPLRQREEDVLLLARRFVEAWNRRHDLEKRLSPQSASLLLRHAWPGNVRELRNAVHRACLTGAGDEVLVSPARSLPPPPIETRDSLTFTLGTPWADIERRMLLKALEYCGNDKTATARLLGISVRTVHNHLARIRADGQH